MVQVVTLPPNTAWGQCKSSSGTSHMVVSVPWLDLQISNGWSLPARKSSKRTIRFSERHYHIAISYGPLTFGLREISQVR